MPIQCWSSVWLADLPRAFRICVWKDDQCPRLCGRLPLLDGQTPLLPWYPHVRINILQDRKMILWYRDVLSRPFFPPIQAVDETQLPPRRTFFRLLAHSPDCDDCRSCRDAQGQAPFLRPQAAGDSRLRIPHTCPSYLGRWPGCCDSSAFADAPGRVLYS